MLITDYFASPIGLLQLAATDTALCGLRLVPAPAALPDSASNAVVSETISQLQAYFAGRLQHFTVPLADCGTPFQKAVWQALREIPYGKTLSYGALAAHLGCPGAARAVGNAVGQNPILILTPCHRIIRADGSLGGFSAGLAAKHVLHRIEGVRTI